MSKLSELDKKDGNADYLFHCKACGYSHGVWVTSKSPYTGAQWSFNGNMEKPTFSPSLNINATYKCHSFITDGKIQYLNDCTHSMAGLTLEMDDIDE
jgi:hypothetical protein